jgi:hypothetical protein
VAIRWQRECTRYQHSRMAKQRKSDEHTRSRARDDLFTPAKGMCMATEDGGAMRHGIWLRDPAAGGPRPTDCNSSSPCPGLSLCSMLAQTIWYGQTAFCGLKSPALGRGGGTDSSGRPTPLPCRVLWKENTQAVTFCCDK